MNDSFYLPASPGHGLYKEKGSKFLSFLFPVDAEEEVKQKVEAIKKDHPKARHHCYAYRYGGKGEVERANDDGEPSGSAGLPILNQIRSAEMTNVLIVVVRYFGGTKLGMSGLIRAYKEAASSSLQNVKKKKYIALVELKIVFPIASLGDVERILARHEVKPNLADYAEVCAFKLKVEEGTIDALMGELYAVRNIEIET